MRSVCSPEVTPNGKKSPYLISPLRILPEPSVIKNFSKLMVMAVEPPEPLKVGKISI
jgi:hypothetical protein